MNLVSRSVIGRIYFFGGLVLLVISLLLLTILAPTDNEKVIMYTTTIVSISILILFLGLGVLIFRRPSFLDSNDHCSTLSAKSVFTVLVRVIFASGLVVVITGLILTVLFGEKSHFMLFKNTIMGVLPILILSSLLLDFIIKKTR